MPIPLRLCALACAACAALLCAPAAAPARTSTGPCFPGAAGAPCHFQTARVTGIADGDTIDVRLDGDRSGLTHRIRFRAVQAMELTRYSHVAGRRRGECHGVAAADRVQRLVRASHDRVRLSAQVPAADSRGRLLRWLAVRRGGRWHDLGAMLMREGHTLFLDSTTDTAWNRRYEVLEQRAARRGRHLWSTTTCGAGPQQHVPIRIWALTDPAGRDDADGEWIKVQNRSASQTLRLGGWWVRDAMLRRFTFPARTTVAPGATVTVHVGHGADHGSDLFWGLPSPIFANADARGDLGDGAYLFDPQGDLRASMLYPCRIACTDPYQGRLRVTALPHRPERILVRNVSAAPVDLYGYQLSTAGSSWAFPPGSTIDPGATLTVYPAGDPRDDTRSVQHLGRSGYALPDAGGWVSVSTFTGIPLACDAWGDAAECGATASSTV